MSVTSQKARALVLGERIANPLLYMAAALPMLLLMLLAFALMAAHPAKAAEEVTCNGRNILTELKQENPKAYEAGMAIAEKVPNGNGIFWKIEKDGLAPSWLLGTMHVTDPRVTALPEAARPAYKQAATVVIESTDVLDDQKVAAAMMGRPDLTMIADGKTISNLINADEVKKLDDGLKSRGIPLLAVARMQPWLISSFIALPACETKRKNSGTVFLDKKLALDAKAEGREVLGLETMAEQLQAMADLPVEFHIRGLIETLALGDRMTDIFETMTALYLEGKVGEIMPMIKAATPDTTGDGEGYTAFEERLIRDRNHVMAERAAPILTKGNVFIAVGALHLPGEEGVVALLQKQGFKVTPVN